MRGLGWWIVVALLALGGAFGSGSGRAADGAPFALTVRTREPLQPGADLDRAVLGSTSWEPPATAVIVCDMWDAHHCLNAVRRAVEMAPRLNAFLHEARRRGALIIHAPSSCVGPYADHPARRRAQAAPQADDLPSGIADWCQQISREDMARYPIDQSDGGEDDDLAEHARWHEQLAASGLNPRAPWTRQLDLIDIRDEDAISDSGIEIWNLMAERRIQQVMLVGVHTNMCVLGRPFGLRQLAQHGKQVVLVRDLTDTMYNPQRAPFVSHFSGTDLIVEYIEKYVCPTITSDQLLGGRPFRFSRDQRPHVVLIMAEDEYDTEHTLTRFAREQLQRDCRLSFVYGDPQQRHTLPGLQVLDEADLAIVSVRRRALPADQMACLQRFVAAGKPLIGLRTASHAFAVPAKDVPPGCVTWPEFDQLVLGGNYQGHYGNKAEEGPVTRVWRAEHAADHPCLAGVPAGEFVVRGWLYKTRPLRPGTTLLLEGRVGDDSPHEPVAWTSLTSRGGRVFYTSLGHPDDFSLPAFQRLLRNGIDWSLDRRPGNAAERSVANQ